MSDVAERSFHITQRSGHVGNEQPMSHTVIGGMTVRSATEGRCDLILDGIEVTGAVSLLGQTVLLRFDGSDQIVVGDREVVLRCTNATGSLSIRG